MSSGLIALIFIVALILIVGYVVAVILRQRHEALLAALPGCIGSIRNWQAQMKVLPEATALIGVGEGATMALR